MLDQTILACLKEAQPRHLEDLKAFIRFPSVSAQPEHAADCHACAQWLIDRMQSLNLQAELITSLGRPAVYAHSEPRPDKPTLLVYGHYDVQPPDPLDLWNSPPFEPTVRDGNIIARGASDDKAQVLAWIEAVEVFRAAGRDLPVNIKFFIEGEEEVGSPSLEEFVHNSTELLSCDAIAISDTTFFDAKTPCVTYGTRGLVYAEVTIIGPSMDLHSGSFGGAVRNPIHVLTQLVAALHDADGRVNLRGFYDDVFPLTEAERKAWLQLNLDEPALKAALGVDQLYGEAGYTTLERIWGRPTLDCNGICGGYTGAGPKTVLPASARAKLSCRLVPGQNPRKILDSMENYFRTNCPPGAQVLFKEYSCDWPWMMPVDSPTLAPAVAAMTEAFGAQCKLIRAGGTIPITAMFQRELGVDPLMMGFGLPDDRHHSPNEKMSIDNYFGGIRAAAALMHNLAAGSD